MINASKQNALISKNPLLTTIEHPSKYMVHHTQIYRLDEKNQNAICILFIKVYQ